MSKVTFDTLSAEWDAMTERERDAAVEVLTRPLLLTIYGRPNGYEKDIPYIVDVSLSEPARRPRPFTTDLNVAFEAQRVAIEADSILFYSVVQDVCFGMPIDILRHDRIMPFITATAAQRAKAAWITMRLRSGEA